MAHLKHIWHIYGTSKAYMAHPTPLAHPRAQLRHLSTPRRTSAHILTISHSHILTFCKLTRVTTLMLDCETLLLHNLWHNLWHLTFSHSHILRVDSYYYANTRL